MNLLLVNVLNFDIYNLKSILNSIFWFVAPFICEHDGKRYRNLEKFNSGVNGCEECICLDGIVNCDDSKCQILVDPPEASTEYVPRQPVITQPPPLPPVQTTTSAPVVPSRGSEKGPSSPELGYYGGRLVDVNPNSEKGPTEPMSYIPEQYQYLQAQVGLPGLRGPPGINSNIKMR